MSTNNTTETFDLGGGHTLSLESRNSALHREDGPAFHLSGPDGFEVKLYFQNGQLSHAFGPAVDFTLSNGVGLKERYQEGKRSFETEITIKSPDPG